MSAPHPSSDQVSTPVDHHDPYQIYAPDSVTEPIQDHLPAVSKDTPVSSVVSGLWWTHAAQYAASFTLSSLWICFIYSLASIDKPLTVVMLTTPLLICLVVFLLGLTHSGPRLTNAARASSDLHQYRVMESATVPCRVLKRRGVRGLPEHQARGIHIRRRHPAAMVCEAVLPDGTTRTVLSLVPDNMSIPVVGSAQRIRLHPTVSDAGLLTGEAAPDEEVQAVRRFGLYPAAPFTTFLTVAAGVVGGLGLSAAIMALAG